MIKLKKLTHQFEVTMFLFTYFQRFNLNKNPKVYMPNHSLQAHQRLWFVHRIRS